jgi:hypothetical protein
VTSQTRQGSGHDWDDGRKAALFADIVSLKLSIDEAAALHGLRVDVIQEWLRLFRRSALVAFDERLKKTLIDQGANADALTAAEFTGHVEDVSIADLVQTIEIAGKDAVITVTHEGTDSRMWCSAGAIIDAESGRLSGEAAVYRILAFERGRMVADLRPEQRARTIYAATHRLLLEAMRRKDESAQLERKLGNINRFYRLGERSTTSRVRVSTDELSILRLFEGPRRLRDVLAQSHIGDLESLNALVRLVEDGYLVENDAAPQPPRPASDVRTQQGARALIRTERLDPAKLSELTPRTDRAQAIQRSEAPTRREASARPMPPPRRSSAARNEAAARDEAPASRRVAAPPSEPSPRAEVARRSDTVPRSEPVPRGDSSVRSEAAPRNDVAPRIDAGPRSDAAPHSEAAPRGEATARSEATTRSEVAPRGEATARSEASTLPPIAKRGRGDGSDARATDGRSEGARHSEVGDGTHAATSFAPISVPQRPGRKTQRWLLATLAVMVLAPAAFWFGETMSNLRAARRAHAAGSNLESRTAALDVAPTFSVATRIEPPIAEIWLDRHPVATGQLGIILPKDGSTHELRAAADGYIPVTLMFADVPPPKLIRLEALPAGTPSAATEAAVDDATSTSPTVASAARTPAPPSAPPRAARPAPRASAPVKKRAANAAALGADTTPSAAARVIEPASTPAPHVQIIDEGAPKVRVIE